MEQYEKAGFKKITGDELGTLTFNPFDKIGKQWALITAGDEKIQSDKSDWLKGEIVLYVLYCF